MSRSHSVQPWAIHSSFSLFLPPPSESSVFPARDTYGSFPMDSHGWGGRMGPSQVLSTSNIHPRVFLSKAS